MKVQVEDREGLFKSLTVELEGDLVKQKLDEAYKQLQQTVQIQGFRKGKAPLWIVRAKYKDYVEEQVAKQLADETLKEALDKAGVKPVADIFLENYEVSEKDNKLKYVVSFEVAPEFELKNVEGVEVEVPKIEFKEEMVEEELQRLREANAVWEPKEENEPAEEGDLLVLEYEVEEVVKEGEKVKQETSVILGQGMLRPEVEEVLKGKKAGDEVELKELPLYDQQGKEIGKVNIRIKVKEIKKKILPELNDEFAQELGYDNLEELKKKIEEDLKQKIEKLRQSVIEDRVADKLVEMHEIEVPQTLLRREISFLVERRLRELQAYGIDTRYVDIRKIAEEAKPIAEANIKLRFILDKYAEQNNIQPTEEDIEEQYKELAEQYGTTVEEIKKYFQEQGLEEVVKEDAKRKKALKDIISKVKLVEVEEKKEEKKEEVKQEQEVKENES